MDLAVLVACGTFSYHVINPLTYTEHDLEIVKHSLTFYCGLEPHNVICFSDSASQLSNRPTRSNIIHCLYDLQSKQMSINNLYFYFSGHGFRSYLDNKDYLTTADTCPGCLEDTALSLDLICRLLKNLNSNNIILFLDACKSVIDSKSLVENFTFDPANKYLNGIAVFYSCSLNQNSFEEEQLKASIFTYCLGQALSETGGCRTVGELADNLTKSVPSLCKKYGKPEQKPYTCTENQGLENVFLIGSLTKDIFFELRSPVPFCGRSISSQTIFAIDFGMTKSIIAAPLETGNELIPSFSGSIFVPTSISFNKSYQYVTGEKSINKIGDDEYITIRNFKRDLGFGKYHEIFGLKLSVEMISLLFLKSLIRNAEEYYQIKVTNCMVSTPANFHFLQNHAMESIISHMGLHLIRTIGEPCCAALNLPEPSSHAETSLIVDLGGGTLDITVMEVGDGVYETLFISGDHLLGGLDYDMALSDAIRENLLKCFPLAKVAGKLEETILKEAERAKKLLNTNASVTIILGDIELSDGSLADYKQTITYNDFLQITEPLNARISAVLDSIKQYNQTEAPLTVSSILLGGIGSKICSVKQLLKDRYPTACLIETFCEKAVIEGLCTYAGKLNGLSYYGGTKKNNPADILLLDCLYYIITVSSCPSLVLSDVTPTIATESMTYLRNKLLSCLIRESCTVSITGLFQSKERKELLSYFISKQESAFTHVSLYEYAGNIELWVNERKMSKVRYYFGTDISQLEITFNSLESIDLCITDFGLTIPFYKIHSFSIKCDQELQLGAYYPNKEKETIFYKALDFEGSCNTELELYIDSDANRTLLALLIDRVKNCIYEIQLNNLYKNKPSYLPPGLREETFTVICEKNNLFTNYENEIFRVIPS